jgi:hypothetical protein
MLPAPQKLSVILFRQPPFRKGRVEHVRVDRSSRQRNLLLPKVVINLGVTIMHQKTVCNVSVVRRVHKVVDRTTVWDALNEAYWVPNTVLIGMPPAVSSTNFPLAYGSLCFGGTCRVPAHTIEKQGSLYYGCPNVSLASAEHINVCTDPVLRKQQDQISSQGAGYCADC